MVFLTPNNAVNGMSGKVHIRLTAIPLSLCVMGTAIANESKINEHKNNRTGDTISNADNVRHADRHTAVDVDTATDMGEHQADRSFDAPGFYMQMPADMQQRRQLFLKQMEERKLIMDRIRDSHRKAVEMRRNQRRLQMNQTYIKTDLADQA